MFSFDFLHDHHVDAESAKICAVKSELAKENKAFVRLKKMMKYREVQSTSQVTSTAFLKSGQRHGRWRGSLIDGSRLFKTVS